MRCLTLLIATGIGCGETPIPTEDESRDTARPVQSTFDIGESSEADDTGGLQDPGDEEDADPVDTGEAATLEDTMDLDGDGFSVEQGDCDDAEPQVHPSAQEVCDGLDNDCDGQVDGANAIDSSRFYGDADQDGFGDSGVRTQACAIPDGFVANDLDCDDRDDTAYPGAWEVCDGVDNDCNGEVDPDSSLDAVTWFRDRDMDGYGTAGESVSACAPPAEDYALTAGDCDDGESLSNPGQVETCDELDNDCDGEIDEGDAGPTTWYKDADGDGFGDPEHAQITCEVPGPRWVTFAGDCDDADAAAHPDGVEVCDGADNDCDGAVDPVTSLDVVAWYIDADGDGYGVESGAVMACDPPADEYVARTGDCSDEHASAHPGAWEVCDEVDNDCDGAVDEGEAAPSIWYRDADGDGFGAEGSARTACASPGARYIAVGGDCQDDDSGIHPDATELCTADDRNCDGDPGNGAVTWFNVSGIPTDVTAEMADPDHILRLEHSGELWICEGAQTSRIVTTGADVSIIGHGDRVGLSGDDDGPVIRALADTNSLTVRNLYISNGQAVKGGGIRAKDAAVVVENTTVAFNEAEEQGGGIYLESGSLELIDASIMYNFILLDGRGAGVRVEAGDVDVVDSLIEYNMGVGNVYGGGIAVGSGRVFLDGSTVEWNEVSRSGGGILVSDGDLVLYDSKVRDNHADRYGGGARVAGNLLMDNSMFRSNSASWDGGGVSIRGVDGAAPLLSCTGDDDAAAGFRENRTADGAGGALHSAHDWVEIDSFTCDWGQAETNNSPHDVATHFLTVDAGADATFECTSAYWCGGEVRSAMH